MRIPSWNWLILLILAAWPVSAQTPRPELLIQTGHAQPINALAVSADNKVVATASSDRTARLWETATGRELRVWRVNAEANGLGFSADGKLVRYGNQAWQVVNGKETMARAGFPVLPQPLGTGLYGRLEIGPMVGGLELRPPDRAVERVKQAFLSADGQWLAAEAANAPQLTVWNAKTGALLQTARGRAPVFSADSKFVAFAGGPDFTSVTLLELATGKANTFGGKASSSLVAASSADGKWLAVATNDRQIKLWDLVSGAEVGHFGAQDFRVSALAFSPDGLTLAAGGAGRARLWNTATGQLRRDLTFAATELDLTLSFNADGRLLAVGYGSSVAICDGGGQVLRTLPATVKLERAPAFTVGGALLAQARDNGALKLWDAITGREIRSLNLSPAVWAVSANGWLATGDKDGAQLWNLNKSGQKPTLRLKGGPIDRLDLNADGSRLLAQTGHLLHVYDFPADTLKEFDARADSLNFAVFAAGSRLVATAATDGPVKLWDAANGRELLNLVALNQTDWLVVTPDNFFDGSPAAWNLVLWRYDEDTFNVAPIEWFFNEFYAPSLLAEIADGKRPRAAFDFAAKDRRQPSLKISVVNPPAANANQRLARLRLEIADAPPDKTAPNGCGARDVRLFRNGALVGVWRGDILKGQTSVALETAVRLTAGPNQFTAYGFNRDNVKSKTVALAVSGSEKLRRAPQAHILAVGVNQYANREYNLKYAAADASEFAKEVQRQLEKQKRYERVNVTLLLDGNATKANIADALRRLAQQSQPEDAVIVYFAGHGTAQQNQFYLIPHDLGYQGRRNALDAKGLSEILTHGISDRELQDLFEPIDAGAFLFVIDACNSGQALEAEEKRRGPMNAKGLAQLAYEKGMYILTAAQSYQAALEAAQLGHGYLTYALVSEGLQQNAADQAPRDGQIALREWFDYAAARVPQMQLDKLKQARQLGLNLSFAEEAPPPTLRANAPPPREAQRPRVFYRRELEAAPFIIAKP